MERNVGDLAGTPRKQPPGWWRWASIGCGAVILLLVVALAAGVFSSQRMLVWGVARLADRVVASLPEGIPQVVREGLRRRLDCVVRAARERRVSEQRLGEFARECVDALADKSISAEELARIESLALGFCGAAGGVAEP
ncbi:MAG: hypothetical protein MUO25_12850 [Thermoanaerobaculaceae bacterium]|jgi:hypothetical protein|nr:hypothetical protein [Thermoanaerobaculaceae bacterium]